jgi:hypothetical protein
MIPATLTCRAYECDVDVVDNGVSFKIFSKTSYGVVQCLIILTTPLEVLIYAIESPNLYIALFAGNFIKIGACVAVMFN